MCRLIVNARAAGDWNMAVDEMLLDLAAEGQTALRFYGWQEPTVSLGYFQNAADRQGHLASRNCPAVRRLTGGGTILHDVELTYSLVVPGGRGTAKSNAKGSGSCRRPSICSDYGRSGPKNGPDPGLGSSPVPVGHRLAADRDRLYSLVHGALVEALKDWRIEATVFCPSGEDESHDGEFLCFQRRTPGDVVFRGMKIAGSAQRRRRGAVLQHGSVLLARSAAAPELPGLAELAGIRLSAESLAAAWLSRLAAALGLSFAERQLSPAEQRQAEAYVARRYASADWTQRRVSS